MELVIAAIATLATLVVTLSASATTAHARTPVRRGVGHEHRDERSRTRARPLSGIVGHRPAMGTAYSPPPVPRPIRRIRRARPAPTVRTRELPRAA